MLREIFSYRCEFFVVAAHMAILALLSMTTAVGGAGSEYECGGLLLQQFLCVGSIYFTKPFFIWPGLLCFSKIGRFWGVD